MQEIYVISGHKSWSRIQEVKIKVIELGVDKRQIARADFHVCRRWCYCQVVTGDLGRNGLVLGAVGNDTNAQICVWHGVQQGRTTKHANESRLENEITWDQKTTGAVAAATPPLLCEVQTQSILIETPWRGDRFSFSIGERRLLLLLAEVFFSKCVFVGRSLYCTVF